MNLNTYQEQANRTVPNHLSKQQLLNNMQMGLSGESGEIADHLKKAWYQGHTLDEKELKKELGDLLWYIALGSTALGVSLQDIAEMNINKLKNRYPEGFSENRSVNRDE